MVAQHAVVHAEIMYQWMSMVRSQTLDRFLPGVQSDDDWLKLYRNHRDVTKAVSFVFDLDGMWPYRTSDVQREIDNARLVSSWARQQPQMFEEFIREEFKPMKVMKHVRAGIRLAQRNYDSKLRMFAKAAFDNYWAFDDEEENFDAQLQETMGLHFYMRVALPCMCVYRKFPLTVLRMAKRECLENSINQKYEWLENLLRLDPYLAGSEFVKKWINRHGGDSTLERRKLVAQWTTEGLDTGRELTAKKVKYWLGGLIWAIGQRFGKVLIPKPMEYGAEGPMTSGEILELFHAWAKDVSPCRGKDCLHVRDEDLTEIQPESWRRAIRPYRNQWYHIISGGGGWNSG